jgi:hypothetical protein
MGGRKLADFVKKITNYNCSMGSGVCKREREGKGAGGLPILLSRGDNGESGMESR